MIKSTNIFKPEDRSTEKYPYLGYLKSSSGGLLVVLFDEPDNGTVILAPSDVAWKIGTYYEDWVETQFKEYWGTVTLENEK